MGAKDKAKKDDPKAEAAKAAAKKEKAENDLIKACKNDELSKAKKCVEAGADLSIDATGTGSTPLHVAAGFGSYEVCKFLHSANANLDALNNKRMTPLDVATQVGEDKIVRLLQALMRGEAPPEEAPEVEDDEDDEVGEGAAGAEGPAGEKPIAPPEKEAAPQEVADPYPVSESIAAEVVAKSAAAEVAEVAAALKTLSFKLQGKLGISLEKNVVAKVGDAGTQAAELGVQEGWVLKSVGGTDVPADKASIMKQAAAALKAAPEGVDFCFEVPGS